MIEGAWCTSRNMRRIADKNYSRSSHTVFGPLTRIRDVTENFYFGNYVPKAFK